MAPARAGESTSTAELSASRALLGLVAIALLALLLRAQGFEWVFVDEATVVFPPGDAQYHVRRSLQAFLDFPRVMLWDSYINYPDGAAISWPPLFDFMVAALARLFVSDVAGFDRFVAWLPPVIGTLAIFPVYLTARELSSRAAGLGAALLLAGLPLSVSYSRVGQLDHHCAVALFGAWLLFANVAVVSRTDARLGWACALGIARLAMLLTWHGSLLYLALLDGTLWLVAAIAVRRDIHAVQAGSALVALVVLVPSVWLFPEPLGGAYSAIALSRLHVLAMTAVMLVSAGLFWLERSPEAAISRMPAMRLAVTFGVGLAVIVALGLLPGVREGLEPALRFLSMTDGVGARTGEQLPLFPWFGRPTGRPVTEVWGALAWFIPLMPFGVLLSARSDMRLASFVVAGWTLYFGVLAILQRRYGNDLGPAMAVATAVTVGMLARQGVAATRLPKRAAPALASVLGLCLLASPILGIYRARAQSAVRALQGGYASRDLALETVAGSLTRFLEKVRRVTPETAGFRSADELPEYGVVADPNLGHAVQNVAHRATPTDPFWAFIGQENWDRAAALLGAESEARALEWREVLGARYVVTLSSANPNTLEGWLHASDGLAARGWARAEHFRLVAEGPSGGVPLAASFRVSGDASAPEVADVVPYKLFEIVNGAVLEVEAWPGVEVRVVLALKSPGVRKLHWRASETADDHGMARFRLLYPTRAPESAERVFAPGLYHVTVGDASRSLPLSEPEIESGAAVHLAFPPH